MRGGRFESLVELFQPGEEEAYFLAMLSEPAPGVPVGPGVAATCAVTALPALLLTVLVNVALTVVDPFPGA